MKSQRSVLLHNLCQYIIYRYRPLSRTPNKTQKSIDPVGLDTESYTNGRCFMVATASGDVFRASDFPACMFGRKYKNTTFVAYKLSYDMGSLLQWLPKKQLRELWENGVVEYRRYKIKVIANKFMRITYNKKDSITFYDMLNFYAHSGENGASSLDAVAKRYIQNAKIHIGTKSFTHRYVAKNWDEIAKYCIHDARLVEELAHIIISMFEEFGVYPRALYSTAYITFQYFYKHTDYVTVQRFWKDHKKLLNYAMYSYNGGKFEVTRKGCDYYYEYDIVSAYPHSIANLIDISHARVIYSKKYIKDATYGFMLCVIDLRVKCYSPIAVKWGAVNIFPVGKFTKVITKQEYDYLISIGEKVKMLDGVFLCCDTDKKPYYNEVMRLFEYKKRYKAKGDYMRCHTVKIFLNSLYGKFVQMIKKHGKIETSTCWNPIYGAIITANTRIAVSRMQQEHPSVVAVHTDSIISTKPLDIPLGKNLGDWSLECEGKGVVLGCGIYQIGNITKARGFHLKKSLLESIDHRSSTLPLLERHAISWREVAFHNWDTAKINLFEDIDKNININFDRKRLWLNDYKLFSDIKKRTVHSVPHVSGEWLL